MIVVFTLFPQHNTTQVFRPQRDVSAQARSSGALTRIHTASDRVLVVPGAVDHYCMLHTVI